MGIYKATEAQQQCYAFLLQNINPVNVMSNNVMNGALILLMPTLPPKELYSQTQCAKENEASIKLLHTNVCLL